MQNFGNPVLSSPSIDFRAVRDQRRASLFYYDLDLSTARSASALTALLLNVSGNVVYIDADPTGGSALIHFQDGNYDRGPVPVYASPGAIFNVPFTQLLIENTAQAGKKLRIVYGVDVDFQPGSVTQIALTGAATDDYISKSANAQNWAFGFGFLTVGAGLTGYWTVKNISSSGLYRINDVFVSTSNATPTPISNIVAYKLTSLSTAPNSQSFNTKNSASSLANAYVATSGPAYSSSLILNSQVSNNPAVSLIGKSPIYVNVGDGFMVIMTNTTATGGGYSVCINYDII